MGALIIGEGHDPAMQQQTTDFAAAPLEWPLEFGMDQLDRRRRRLGNNTPAAARSAISTMSCRPSSMSSNHS